MYPYVAKNAPSLMQSFPTTARLAQMSPNFPVVGAGLGGFPVRVARNPFVTYAGIGTGAVGSTTVSPNYPANISVSDLLVCVVTSGATNSEVPTTPTGWTSRGSYANTDGTFGVDTGPRRATVFTKVAIGNESGTLTVSITNGNTCRGVILLYKIGHAGYTWDIEATGGNDSTFDTSVSVTGSPLSWQPGDLTLISISQVVDGTTLSSISLTASEITFGAQTILASFNVTTGFDHKHVVISRGAITAGTSIAAPTFSYTSNAACSAGVHILRLREVLQ